ncbi:MAG: efflux RND transporter periplasmic adaptor subunit [Verrucomicrobiae bacterium]|nr:efflux RND transporter periplasmic adaptor subunit [Verrucomicrobiae bacterium]
MKKILFFLILLTLLASLSFILIRKFSPSPQSSPPEIVQVKRGNLNVTIQATATIKPENRLEIKPPLAGRAETVEVDLGAKVKQGQVLAWMSSSERAALLDAARAKGSNELAYWQEIYKATPLVAPLDGLIISRSLVPGQVVQSTETVFIMSDRLIAQADLDETDLGKVKMNQKAEVTLDGFPDIALTGKVYKIAYDSVTVNNVTTYQVDVEFNKIPEFLRSGMTANVKFLIEQRKNVLLIPEDTVQNQNTVLVTDGKNQTPRTIKLGLSDGQNIEVLSGLREGESIVRANYQLQEGPNRGMNILPSFRTRGGRRTHP